MDNREEIQQLLHEIQKLDEQANMIKKEIDSLKERLIKLTGVPQPATTENTGQAGKRKSNREFYWPETDPFHWYYRSGYRFTIGVKCAIDKNLISPAMRVALGIFSRDYFVYCFPSAKKKIQTFQCHFI